MLSQRRRTGPMSRLKGSVRTMLHHLPGKKTDDAAGIKGGFDEFNPKLSVLPSTPPALPPPGALIAEKNWAEFATHRRHRVQRNTYYNPAAERREVPSRGAETAASNEMEGTTEHYAPTVTETSYGSDLSSTRMRLGSASTQATSRASIPEEDANPAKGDILDQDARREVISRDGADSQIAPDEKCVHGETLANQTGEVGIR